MVATVEQLAALVRGRLVGDGSVSIHSARPGRRGGAGGHHVHRERAVRQAAAHLARLGRDRRAASSMPARDEVAASLAVIEVDDPMSGVPRGPHPPDRRPQAALDGHPSAGLRRADGPDRSRRGDLSLRLRRRRRGDRRRNDAPPRRRRSATAAGSAGIASSIPTPCSIENVILGDRVEVHAGTVLGGDGFGYRLDRRPARQDPADRAARGRRRRRDRLELHDRPRDVRGDPDRRGHQDRQPGHDRPQQPDRPPQPALRPGRHRRQLQDRRLRRHGRPGGDQGQHRRSATG